MEERSPGSYRFAIRGSSLRSPFGVRNVKVYWNSLPLTDGGGNTYLNLLDFSALGHAEVIKGPGGSQYGAGTGGVLLLGSPKVVGNQVQLAASAGSYGLQRYQIVAQTQSKALLNRIQFANLRVDGFRNQSSMQRTAFNSDMSFFIDPRNTLSTTFFFTDITYGTPGGLTQAQYGADPHQARPASTTLPGAVEQQAGVYNKTLYGGILYEHDWSAKWTSSLGFFGSGTDFKNPAIRNYEMRTERNLGARQVNQYRFDHGLKGKVTFGGEFQYFLSTIKVQDNNLGTPGLVQTEDEVTSLLSLGFAQAELDLPLKFYLTIAGSLNYMQYDDKRISSPAQVVARKFNPVFSPRIALLKKFSEDHSLYLSASKGFSPPTVAEVLPSTGIYNSTLNPESGWSYEAGVRGNFLSAVSYQLTLYTFNLQNTIVLQRDASGADYYVNAGNTQQQGVELSSSWSKTYATSVVSSLRAWTSFTYNHSRFGQYVNDGKDYSGNKLTGVAPVALVLGADVATAKGLQLNITGNIISRTPLNDGNTDFASDYFLLGARMSYKPRGISIPLEFFFGVDNMLDQTYSLGNDINATGGRYYNAAPKRNYYAGIIANFLTGVSKKRLN